MESSNTDEPIYTPTRGPESLTQLINNITQQKDDVLLVRTDLHGFDFDIDT